MKRNPMSLKAIINNIAKENKVSAQSVLQTYMLERFPRKNFYFKIQG